MGIVDRSIDKLSDRLDRLEVEKEFNFYSSSSSESEFQFGLTEEEFKRLTLMERYILKFNWYVKEIMPYYKAEVMSVHNLTSEEYDRRVLEGDQSIYLPQPNKKFEPTSYKARIAAVFGLEYQGLQDRISSGEIKDRIAGVNPETGKDDHWRDENPNAVF